MLNWKLKNQFPSQGKLSKFSGKVRNFCCSPLQAIFVFSVTSILMSDSNNLRAFYFPILSCTHVCLRWREQKRYSYSGVHKQSCMESNSSLLLFQNSKLKENITELKSILDSKEKYIKSNLLGILKVSLLNLTGQSFLLFGFLCLFFVFA